MWDAFKNILTFISEREKISEMFIIYYELHQKFYFIHVTFILSKVKVQKGMFQKFAWNPQETNSKLNRCKSS